MVVGMVEVAVAAVTDLVPPGGSCMARRSAQSMSAGCLQSGVGVWCR